MFISGTVGIFLNSSANASSFGLEAGLNPESFLVGIQLELDTTNHSSLSLNLSSLNDVNLGTKYFWNTQNHSGSFAELSAGGFLALPIFSAYLQQGYFWIIDNQIELEIKGGLGIVRIQGYYDDGISLGGTSFIPSEKT